MQPKCKIENLYYLQEQAQLQEVLLVEAAAVKES
jgi:hypothetical protein